RDRARVIELGAGGTRGQIGRASWRERVCVGVGGLVVAGRVVGDGVEAVAAVDGVVVFIERHVVAEAGAAVAVGVREAEAAVAGLLDVEVDGRDTAAGARVFGLRVHRDRARVIEQGAGGTRG